ASEPDTPADTVQPEDSKKDPVIKSSGQNRQTNTDLTLGTFGGSYAVTRHLAPCSGRGGLLGSSWASGLDTRIIRGQEADRSEEIQKLRAALTGIQAKKAEIEALDSSYDEVKEDIAAALAEADSAIASLTAELEPLEAAQTVREQTKERNSYVLYGGAEAFAECGAGRLVLMKDGFIPLLFERAEDGSYRGTGAARLLAVKETAGGYALTNPDGTSQEFDSYGRLAGETDRNGNEVRIVWGADGRIEEIISPAGCSAKIQSDEAGRITAMSLLQDGKETGRLVKYEYSGDSLSAMTDTDGDTTRYEYDDTGRLTAIVKGDGSAMRYAYTQCSDGSVRVASVTDEEGQVMAFSHDPAARRFSYKPAGGEEEVSLYDAEGRITREESGGLVTEYGYDADGNVTSRTVNGERTEYSYDEKGNLTKALYADGSAEEYGYNSLGQLTCIKDRDGVAETFARDDKGNLTELHTGGVCVAKYSYDGHGLCTEKEIVRGGGTARISYSYDTHGSCIERTLSDPDDTEKTYTEKYEYDGQGRPIKLTSPDGKETCISYTAKTETVLLPGGLERRLTYDGRKNLVLIEETDRKRGQKLSVYCEYDRSHHVTRRVFSERDRTLLTEEMSYNGRGDLASVTTSAAGDGTKKRQLLSYDGAGRLASVRIQKIGPDGTVEDETESKASFRYIGAGRELTLTSGEGRASTIYSDGLGRLVKQTNALGEEFTRSLSPAGRLLSESSSHGGMYAYGYDALGLLAAAGEEGKEQSKADYNPDGSVKRTTDRLGNVTEYSYDIRGLLIKKASPEGTGLYGYDISGRLTNFRRGSQQIRYDYSSDGRTVTATHGDFITETYELDAWGRVIKATDGEGNARTFGRDALGRLTDESDAYGNGTSYRYNAWGKVSEIILPDGSREAYEYNALGLPTKKTDSEGTAWVLRYDRDGLLLEEKSRARAVQEYSYDALGRLTEVKSGGKTQARYEYTAYGRKETLIRAGGSRYEKAFDAYGRLVSETDSHGATRTFAYDAEGRVRERKSFGGNVTQITDDRAGRSYGEAFPDGTENRILLDENRAVIKEENPRASEEYEYDAAGLLVRQKSPLTGEAIEYSYDRRGLCTGVKSPIHHAVYEYGRAGELLHASDKTTGVSLSFKYDALMRETERSFAGGARQLTAYDKAGRIASVRTLDRNGEVKSEYLHYGDDGRILSAMDERGRVTIYGYDKQGRITKVLYPFGNDILSKARLEYEAAGGDRNASADGKDISTGDTLKKAFKTLSGRECADKQKAWEELYAYDADGNRTSKTTPLGTVYYKYDSENRLVSYGVTEAADAARLEYDADGNLIKESTPTKEAVYAYNAANRMAESHVTEIRDGSRQTPKDTVYAYDSFGRRILEADILNRWTRHTEYRGLTMDVWKNAAVHGIKEPRDSRGIDSTGMVFTCLDDFLPAFADFSRASPYDFTHVALTLPLGGAGGEVLGLLQTEHSGIGFNPFVNASHTDAERHYFGKDHLGSVRAVTNQWGSPLYMFDYDVFGTPLQDRPERYRHGFTGKEYDSWTGLYNYGFRDYSAMFGRFTTVDPIQDGLGWYAYVNSDPVNWLDPWGLCPQDAESGEDVKTETLYQGDKGIYSSVSDGKVTKEDEARSLLYEAANFIIKNAETPDERELASTVSFMMNAGKVQLDKVVNRHEKPDVKHSKTELGFFDPYHNTSTGKNREIIVIDTDRAIKNGLGEVIETLSHEGWHKVQYDRGRIGVTADNNFILRFKRENGKTLSDYRTDMELEAYNMGIIMHNKYRQKENLRTYKLHTFEEIRALYPDE
ncbi:MAG: hypothetical protein K6G18_01105, partial [Treponema sp.]|nr:hypothetical protein [Treponema sp.]